MYKKWKLNILSVGGLLKECEDIKIAFNKTLNQQERREGQICCTYVVPKEKGFQANRLKALSGLWCGPGSNRRHKDFQSFALPTELPHLR
jgi:hypothetical protein